MAHRLAWLLVWTAGAIEIHIHGNPGNNQISNLRAATRSQNAENRRLNRNNRTGVKGVCLNRGKFDAYIRHHGGQRLFIGRFATLEDAAAACREAAERLHGEFARWLVGEFYTFRPDFPVRPLVTS
jgi:hypothetical protein